MSVWEDSPLEVSTRFLIENKFEDADVGLRTWRFGPRGLVVGVLKATSTGSPYHDGT